MRHILLMIWITLYSVVFCQETKKPAEGDVGIIEFFRQGHKLSFPLMRMGEGEKLELRFDIFGSEERVLFYTIELCDYDWKPVDLDPMDYIDGYEQNQLYAYSSSMNTLFNYMHYRLIIPNEDTHFILPGNYIVRVFADEERQTELFTRKFIVVDELVKLDVWVDKFESAIYEDRQEIKAKIMPRDLNYNDLAGNIKLTILQNNNWNSTKTFDTYNSDGSGNLQFNTTGQIVFPGMNEFRFFDMKSLKFISERVEYIDYQPPHYHVYLKSDSYRGLKQYFNNEDLNGLFFIGNQESHDPDTLDAEYVKVHFTLDAGAPLAADVYIEGALTDWEMDDNHMAFNPEKGVYEKTLFLKQGLYNYRYITKEYQSDYLSWDITEGSFYETRNSYLGVVYYRPLGEVYYQPVGVGVNLGE